MSKKRLTFLVLLQLVLWSAFIALPYFMVPRQSDEAAEAILKHHSQPQPDMAQHIFFISLAFNVCIIIFFYIHHYFLFDRYVVKKKFFTYISIVLVAFLISFSISGVFKMSLYPADVLHHSPLAFREIVRTLTWFLLILLISLGIKLMAQWRQAEQRTQEIENEQLRTELSFLHAQINPHFLFNSLNTIYSLALTKSDAAPVSVLKLADLLRYVIDESKKEKVPLEQEINYVNNFIELQKLRSTSSLVVSFDVQGDIHSALIAPLLLLPFVENAFKYGISNSETSPIDIKLVRTAGGMEFSVINKKFMGGNKPSTGIGINNVQRRLKLLYQDKHELEINDLPNSYFIKLTIQFV